MTLKLKIKRAVCRAIGHDWKSDPEDGRFLICKRCPAYRWHNGNEVVEPENQFFCICDEEYCFCTNRVAGSRDGCVECAAGHHIWTMAGQRS